MADEKQIQILMSGISKWNLWRKDFPKIKPDLSNAELINESFRFADFTETNLFGTKFINTDLTGTNFLRADISNSIFALTNLTKANFEKATIIESDFTGAILVNADFLESNLSLSVFRKTNLKGVKLISVKLNETDFEEATLQNTVFIDLQLSTSKNLDKCIHHGYSFIDAKSFLNSENLPKEFLFGCGYMKKDELNVPIIKEDYLSKRDTDVVESHSLENLLERRLNDLQKNISSDLEVLSEYEEKLRLEDDPLRRRYHKKQIETLRQSASDYAKEYSELKQNVSNIDVNSQSVNEKFLEIHHKLDELILGQTEIKQDLFDNHQNLILKITEHLTRSETYTINQIVEKIDENKINTSEINNVLRDLQLILQQLEKNTEISIPDKEKLNNLITDPQISSKQKLKFMVPLIPFLLNYEKEIEFSIGVNLKNAWNYLINISRT